MKKLIFFGFLLVLTISCKKKTVSAEPDKSETACLIQRVEYDDGSYEKFVFNADKKLTSCVLTYFDDEGNINEVLLKYEYNSAGNLLKTIGQDGSEDNYTYDANGMLTKVLFTDDQKQIYEEFTVTMDSQKRLTKVVARLSELTGFYEYNGQNNNASKIEVFYQGKIFDRYIVEAVESDNTKKGYDIAITGHPFDPTSFTDGMIYSPGHIKPINSLPTKGKSWTSYDVNWENLTNNLRLYYDYTATRKYNSNNYVIERTSNDAVDKVSYLKKYMYSNCN
jgi:YD repeat-containing protein